MVVLLHAHVMAAGAVAELPPTRRQTTPKYSMYSCAPPVRLEIRLAPGSVATDSCDAAVCSPFHWFITARPASPGTVPDDSFSRRTICRGLVVQY
jgi:hypothetical protein